MILKQNPYPGVHAHLNSWLQTPRTKEQPALFPAFHSRHIAYICDFLFLNEILPDNYAALNVEYDPLYGCPLIIRYFMKLDAVSLELLD